MTFEEIQKTLEGMLQVQKDIQMQQLKNQDAIAQLTARQDKNDQQIALLTENISNLNIISQRHENRLGNLYGYQMSADTDRLNIMQNLLEIKGRLNNIEDKLNAM
ncbi:MAG: hypothetical protein AAGA80_06860 [Cyanobacteria bacterium P01_F01_bin.143]